MPEDQVVTARLNFSDAIAKMTLRVRLCGVAIGGLRIRCGLALIRTAARVIGCHVELELTDAQG